MKNKTCDDACSLETIFTHHAKLCEVWPEVEVTNASASLESRSAGKK